MPQITLDPLSLQGNGFLYGFPTKVFNFSSDIGGQADISVNRLINLKSFKSSFSGSASLSQMTFDVIKYLKAKPTASSSVSSTSLKFKTVKGTLVSESRLEAYTYDRDIRKAMGDYLPRYYGDMLDVTKMLEVEANEVTRLQAKLNELLDQFYVNSSTSGLDRWESVTGIQKIPQRSVDSRRHFINAKLRGVGTVSKRLLKEVVDSFYTSTVEETPGEHNVNVTLIGKRGIPKNLEDIEVAVTDVIPAHIEPTYSFTYLPWSEVDASGLSWEDADTYTHKNLEEAFLIEPPFPHQN